MPDFGGREVSCVAEEISQCVNTLPRFIFDFANKILYAAI